MVLYGYCPVLYCLTALISNDWPSTNSKPHRQQF